MSVHVRRWCLFQAWLSEARGQPFLLRGVPSFVRRRRRRRRRFFLFLRGSVVPRRRRRPTGAFDFAFSNKSLNALTVNYRTIHFPGMVASTQQTTFCRALQEVVSRGGQRVLAVDAAHTSSSSSSSRIPLTSPQKKRVVFDGNVNSLLSSGGGLIAKGQGVFPGQAR